MEQSSSHFFGFSTFSFLPSRRRLAGTASGWSGTGVPAGHDGSRRKTCPEHRVQTVPHAALWGDISRLHRAWPSQQSFGQ